MPDTYFLFGWSAFVLVPNAWSTVWLQLSGQSWDRRVSSDRKRAGHKECHPRPMDTVVVII